MIKYRVTLTDADRMIGGAGEPLPAEPDKCARLDPEHQRNGAPDLMMILIMERRTKA